MTQPVPEGFNTVSAYVIVKDVEAALAFYEKAFGACTGDVMRMPGGQGVLHAEMALGNSMIMFSPENPQWGATSAETLGGSPISLHVYVEDCDALWERAIAAGCTEVAPLMDAFWGDRFGKLQDPFGIQWSIATHKVDLTPEEMDAAAARWFAEMAQQQQP